jgi:hypothetical protein
MNRAKKQKPYWKMNARELAAATKEYDRPIPAHKTRPLSKHEREQWERSKSQPSRSVFIVERDADGTEPILLRLDDDLVRRMDECARLHHLTRSELVEKGIRSALAFVGETPAAKRRRKSA